MISIYLSKHEDVVFQKYSEMNINVHQVVAKLETPTITAASSVILLFCDYNVFD